MIVTAKKIKGTMMALPGNRRNLIDATKLLLCKQGFEAMSPAHIIKTSGAGQGSFYHHFKSKSDLAHHALKEISKEMVADFDARFAVKKNPIDQIISYLNVSRDGVKGCKMGRFANETVIKDSAINVPVTQYFKHVENKLKTALEEARQLKMITADINAQELAITLVAIVQGGFVLSRVHQDKDLVNQATQTAVTLVKSLISKAAKNV